MTSRSTYDFLAAGITPLSEELEPFGYHLATRYITAANWDDTCRESKQTLGAQWGDSLKRQTEILRANGPRPICFVWSDMYEPWNDPYSGFWLRNGSFDDAWKYLPRDFLVLNSHYNAEESKSPRFFAANGYAQIIAGDGRVGEWMRTNADISGIVGVMNVDAPLEEFAAKAWGWLPQEIRDELPPAPGIQEKRLAGMDTESARKGKSSSPSPPEMRTWTDASGQHTVEAAFVNVKSSIVTLQRRDGSEITIPLKALSDEDRRWLFREATSRNAD
jgi:SLA1 homology domain 1, SHD1